MPVGYPAVDRDRPNIRELGGSVGEETGLQFQKGGLLLFSERCVQIQCSEFLVCHCASSANFDRLQAVQFYSSIVSFPNMEIQGGFAVSEARLAVMATGAGDAARTADDTFSGQVPVSSVIM